MRKVVCSLAILLVSLSAFASTEVIKGESNSLMGEFAIEKIDANHYNITYGSGDSFKIDIVKNASSVSYIVRSSDFEIMYNSSNDYGFGSRVLPLALRQVDYDVYKDRLNIKTFAKQQQICTTYVPKKKALKSIAYFMPELLN